MNMHSKTRFFTMNFQTLIKKHFPFLLGILTVAVFVLASSVQPVMAQTCADTLAGDVGSVAQVSTSSSTLVDTGASASLNLGQDGPVLVVSSYFSDNIGSSSLLGSFAISDGTTTSQQVDRYINNPQDYGIGSLVHIFQSSAGTRTYNLQHATDTQVISTTGTIVAISLRTSSNTELGNNMAVRANTFTHNLTSYITIPDTTFTISLPAAGDIFAASSLSTSSGSAGTSRKGAWKLQYRAQGAPDWSDLGYAIERDLSGTKDTGAVSLMAIADNLSAGTYEFSVAVSAVDGLAVETFNLTHIGVALAYDDGTPDEFSSFEAHKVSTSTTSSALVNAVGQLVNLLGSSGSSDVFMGAQYQMTTNGGNLEAAKFDLAVDDGTLYHSQDQWRHLQNSGDIGSGASYGLAQGLSNGTQYAMRLRFASNGTTDLQLDDPYLVGFSPSSSCLSPTVVDLNALNATNVPARYGFIAYWMAVFGLVGVGLGWFSWIAKRRRKDLG